MVQAFRFPQVLLLILSVVGLYFLAPFLDRRDGLWVSASFALLLILSSRPVWDKRHLLKYAAYIAVDMLTYHMLFSDEPWNMLFKAGLFDESVMPLMTACFLMSLNGFLLINDKKNRIFYLAFTLILQLPIGILIGEEWFQILLTQLGQWLHYRSGYEVYLQVWQFEWMLTYYLPIYFLTHKQKIRYENFSH